MCSIRSQAIAWRGIRRGTDVLKAMALGADAVMARRAPLYGLCAGGADVVKRALDILHKEHATRWACGALAG